MPPRGAAAKPSSSATPGSPLGDIDLDRLDKVFVAVALLGVILNLIQLVAISNHAWVQGTALKDGQPFTAYLALDSVTFGSAEDPRRDNAFFCTTRGSCDLQELCQQPDDGATYPQTGLRKNTASSQWCGFEAAGAMATKLLWMGLLCGLVATGITGMYALQSIPWVADQFDVIEELGFSDRIQKYVMTSCWAALCIFIFTSMALYSANIPDTLGWGTVELEASFGLLNLCFVLASINAALCVNSLFELWDQRAVTWVWEDFNAAKWVSARKALYLELTLQLLMYVMMIVHEVDWAVLLIVLAYFYLTSRDPTFMALYLVLVTISILFDSIHAAELPSFAKMTSGESYGATLWIGIFALKPLIFVTIIVHQKLEVDADPDAANQWTNFDEDDERAA